MTTTKTDAQTVLEALMYIEANYDGMDKAAIVRDALPAAQRLVDGWRPIESAPKDGTPILVWSDMGLVKAWYDKNGWCIFDGEWKSWTKPTHWMPLPNPPTTSEEA